jgi:hypothetical protein
MNITQVTLVPAEPNNGILESYKATIDGVEWDVPMVVGNFHYDEIMRQVEAGDLTIADAE